MPAHLVRFELRPGPPDKLPAETGLLETAEEHGLLWVAKSARGFHALPSGELWGAFSSATAALEAFNDASRSAGLLLGFELEISRALSVQFQSIWPDLEGEAAFADCLFHQLYAPPERGVSSPRWSGVRGQPGRRDNG
jgi:hypothetical protein